MVDCLTKYVHFFAISTEYRAHQVVEVFFREVLCLHGLPKSIFSDRDRRFLSLFWQELFRLAVTDLTPSTSYHPQTNGQTEIMNKWLEGYLINYVTNQQFPWIRWLHLGEYCYNIIHHMSIGMSPFKALYGYDEMTFGDLAIQGSRVPGAKDNLHHAQNQQKKVCRSKLGRKSF